jgi:hypothetical protein
MSNAATEQMLLLVRNTKESAGRAEQEYDRKADQLQMKAGQGIDLFGGSAVSQVADIASTSRKICDELYAAYQMLIRAYNVLTCLNCFYKEFMSGLKASDRLGNYTYIFILEYIIVI